MNKAIAIVNKIEQLSLSSITMYKRNAKLHPREQIEQIKQSILDYGFNDPIAVDEKNVIIEGHGRYIALKELGYTDCPCIRLSHLNQKQKKAYILVHNKLTMNTGFDPDILAEELKDLFDIDMAAYDFELPDIVPDESKEEPEPREYYGDERERTAKEYKLHEAAAGKTTGYYQMPVLDPCHYIPDDLIGFNYVLTAKDTKAAVHFYLDDYQFSRRIWDNTEFWIEKLRPFPAVLTPDFSLYMDMPMAVKVWNTYRNRMIGQILQREGMYVIPTVSWAEPETYDFCFDGLPEGSVVSVSTIGAKEDKESFKIWRGGMDEMMRRLQPSTVLVYGGEVEYDYGSAKPVYYKNQVTERWKGSEQTGEVVEHDLE